MKKTVLKENNSCRMQCIAEENLEQEMDSQVEPFLKQVQICGWMEVAPEGGESQERDVASADSTSQKSENAPEDGVAQRKTAKTGGLYYELYPQETKKGTIVISYGFTESCLKYHELIYYFYLQGYKVAIMDHRGHGKSMREVEDHTIVHIGLFSRYVKDLHRFVKTVVKPMAKDLPLYLYAHSMGGCIGAFYLEQYPEDFAKAVLNAPMLGVNLGGVPSWAARAPACVTSSIQEPRDVRQANAVQAETTGAAQSPTILDADRANGAPEAAITSAGNMPAIT